MQGIYLYPSSHGWRPISIHRPKTLKPQLFQGFFAPRFEVAKKRYLTTQRNDLGELN